MRLSLTRRVMTAVLALLFTSQSAGSALATTPPGVTLSSASLSEQVASALQALRATHVGAILSGDGGRWAAMHAPPPVFKHEAPPQVVFPARHVVDLRQFRTGVFRAGPHMLSRPLDINEAPKDPRAMGQGTPSCARSGQLCTTPVLLPNAGVHAMSIAPNTALLGATAGVRTTSITPTVQPFLFEADTTSGPTTPIFVTAGIESGAISRTMDSAPANASANRR